MQKSYELSQDEKQRIICRPISKEFCDRYPWAIKGYGEPDFKRFDIAHNFVMRDYPKHYKRVKECLRRNENKTYDLVKALIEIWQQRMHPNESAKMILKRYRLIFLDKKAEDSNKDRYSLDQEVNKLLDFLYESFRGDLDSVRFYFLSTEPEDGIRG